MAVRIEKSPSGVLASRGRRPPARTTAIAASTPLATSLRIGAPLLVGAVTFACFAPALGHGFVVWDDEVNFTLNTWYRGLSPAHLKWMFSSFHMGHYQPLSWLTLGVDYELWGMDAHGYHLTNVLLHAANAVLFYWLSLRLLRLAGRGDDGGAALGATAALSALLFAVHPLRVESVAWISERRDVLSAFFFLATVIAYLRMQEAATNRGRWYAASIALLTLSLLSKAWGMSMPVVLLALDFYPLRRLERGAKLAPLLLEKIPYVAVAAVAAIVAVMAQQSGAEMLTLAQHGVAARIAQAAYGLCFYLAKTLVPLRLSPVYVLEPNFDPLQPLYVGCVVAVLVLTGAALAGWKRWPWWTVGWICFVAIVAPVLGAAQTGPQIAADRYTYLACLPWALLAAAGVERLARQRHTLAVATAVAVVAVLAVLTVQQTNLWRDSVELWNHALRLDAGNVIAYTNRGAALESEGKLDEAVADYEEAIGRDANRADAYFGRGNVRRSRGDLAGAFADYDMFVRLRPQDPRGYANRGGVKHLRGDVDGAAADYRRALELAPPDWAFRETVTGNLAEIPARSGS